MLSTLQPPLDARLDELVSNDIAGTLIDDMDRRGFGVIEDFIGKNDLSTMKRFTASTLARTGNRYIGLTGSEAVRGSGLDELASSVEFQDLFRRIYEGAMHKPAPDVVFHQLYRCLAGQDIRRHSYYFHYDSYLITALVPIEIPQVGKTGDLLMLPNTRPVRSTYGANVFDKLLLENRLTQAALRYMAKANSGRFRRLRLKPGNIYFFWGYRSIHANEDCDPEQIRATALFHYANPHDQSSLQSWMKRLH